MLPLTHPTQQLFLAQVPSAFEFLHISYISQPKVAFLRRRMAADVCQHGIPETPTGSEHPRPFFLVTRLWMGQRMNKSPNRGMGILIDPKTHEEIDPRNPPTSLMGY
jgi:hypothetical protein